MRWASIPGRTSANACLSARGGPASGLASRISTRRSVYFHASMRRCGRPAASKRRNAASRGPAWSRRPGRRALTAAKLSARPVSAAVLMRGVSTFMALCRLVLVSSIALGFELESELLAAGAHDAALRQHMHDIRHDMVEEPLIMGDDDHGALGRAQPIDAVRHQDRKSTRLNSSHLGISYAVFCLKKKNSLGSLINPFFTSCNSTERRKEAAKTTRRAH